MATRHTLFFSSLCLLGLSHPAFAEWRCDCTTVIDSCNAEVSVQGNWVEVTTDSPQCSRVDYFIDGLPFVAVVVEGEDRQNWLTRTEDPRVLVQSCQVCRDNVLAPAGSGPASRASAAEGSEAALEPLIEVAPAYPEAAQNRGVEGHVELQFTVSPYGLVEDPRVVGAEPPDVFDQAALAAVRRWRYPADPEREAQTLTQRIEFTLSDYIQQASAQAAASAEGAAAPPAGAPLNRCVREDAAYNYGDMIEVDLMSACQQPLLVYGCAGGTGRYLGHWVCTHSERQQTVLVPPGDARLGTTTMVNTAEGPRAYRYADSFFVARAPNTQYWWIACHATDGDCRGRARQWTRAVDRQLSSVDPSGRASITIARSY